MKAAISFKSILGVVVLLGSLFFLPAFKPVAPNQATVLEGSWQLTEKPENNITVVRNMQDGFFSVAYFNLPDKKFIGTYGGSYTLQNGKFTATYQFNTFDSTKVGSKVAGTFSQKNGKWQIQTPSGKDGKQQTWVKVKEKTPFSPLAGAWRISGREVQNGQMNSMQLGPRRTIKILSDDRFQWIAFNLETAAFSGTGGGTYTLKDGKYTEHIEFFSRDNNRVGLDLTFNYEVKDGNWHHSGLSSTGGKVNEIWTRLTSE